MLYLSDYSFLNASSVVETEADESSQFMRALMQVSIQFVCIMLQRFSSKLMVKLPDQVYLGL